jgi:antitoxin CptB
MLELDILLSGFLDRHEHALDHAQIEAFERLLAYPDAELWDIIAGRKEVDEGEKRLIDLIGTN